MIYTVGNGLGGNGKGFCGGILLGVVVGVLTNQNNFK